MAPILDFQTRYDQRNASYRSSQKDNLDDIVELSSSASHNSNKGSSGGGNMSEYVTHEELNHVEDNLRHEIKETKIELQGAIKDTKTELSGKIDKLSDSIDHQSKLIWWLMSILSAGIVIPLITYVVMFIIKHH